MRPCQRTTDVAPSLLTTGGARVCRAGPRPGPPLPRPVLPRERGIMDRMMDYLVGDGPANRYALICCQCHGHNGMALKEEFEYLGKAAGPATGSTSVGRQDPLLGVPR